MNTSNYLMFHLPKTKQKNYITSVTKPTKI